jgi:DNA-binding NtrC family response regulator
MLIQKSNSIEKGDITVFKLANGDEIISRIDEVTDSTYVLDRPCLVMPSQQGIGLIQAMFSTDKTARVILNKAHVMMTANAVDAMEKHYVQTTTGIIS